MLIEWNKRAGANLIRFPAYKSRTDSVKVRGKRGKNNVDKNVDKQRWSVEN